MTGAPQAKHIRPVCFYPQLASEIGLERDRIVLDEVVAKSS